MCKSPNQEMLYRKLYGTSTGLYKGTKEYGTCKECKNWSNEEGFSPYCKKVMRSGSTSFFTSLEYVETGPDFGCVHFEKQQKPGV